MKAAALLLAFGLWAYAVLERSYDHRFVVPIVLQRGADTTVVVTDIDAVQAQVTVEAKGKDLLRLRYRRMQFRPEVPATRPGIRQVRLSAADLELPAQVVVRSINPEVVEMKLSPAAWKSVSVVVPTRGQLAEVAGRRVALLGVTPLSRVRLTGPEEELALVELVNTETLDLSSVRRAGRYRLRVVPPGEGFRVQPETVDVDLVLEREVARILLDVPVRVVAPAGVRAEVEPTEAQVAVAGPQSRIDSLRGSEVSLRVNIGQVQPGTYRLVAEVAGLPPGFRLVKCEPAQFEVTVR
ncbi:MAG: CdaR family protein [candidate division WOR-3 bacterium]